MKLKHGLHLACCLGLESVATWPEIFSALDKCVPALREQICPRQRFGLSLSLHHRAARQLSEPPAVLAFRKWLDQHQCYVFTINGSAYGHHPAGTVKEQVYAHDWTTPERVAYTNLLFDLLARLVPPDVPGSVSTLPASYKGFVRTPEEVKILRNNLWRCVEHIARLGECTERKLHLALEPAPLGLLECSAETLQFFERLRTDRRNDHRLDAHLGVNYDSCHFAVEYEEPQNALAVLHQHGIQVSKIHVGNALKVRPTPEARQALAAFKEDAYLHQVVVRRPDGHRVIYSDLDDALATEPKLNESQSGAEIVEWRIHSHVPLASPPMPPLANTSDHVLGVFDWLAAHPGLCSHMEMQTYTWDTQPAELRNLSLVERLGAEYEWTVAQLAERGIGPEE